MQKSKFQLTALFLLFCPQAFTADEPSAVIDESVGKFFSIKATDHLLFSNSNESGDKNLPQTKILMNEATLRAEYGQFNGKLQISNRYTPDGSKSKNAPFKLEKKLLALESEHWDIKLGDSNQELGRGIALSLYNDTAFGIDNTLEGVSVKYKTLSTESQIFSGRVNSLRSPVAINPAADPLATKDVWMGAAALKVKYSENGKVGGHYLLTQNQDPLSLRFTKRQQTAGLTLSQEELFGSIDAYAESNFLITQILEPIRKNEPNGQASYASLSYAANPWKVKTEFKDYRQYKYEFERPPTMEEDIITKNNFEDVTASRVLIERRLSDTGTASAFTSYLVGMDREVGAVINHPVVGAKIPFPGKIETEFRAGYRWLPSRENAIHGSVKGKIRTFKGQALEAEYRKQFWNHDLQSSIPNKEERNQFSLGYIFNERFSVVMGYEYIPTGNPTDGKNFANGGAVYKTGSFNSRAFLGQTSGGTQCSGGICRPVPPYTGAYLETTVTF